MTERRTWGLLAEFNSAREVYLACEQVRDAGFSKWDAHTPFPVHGLDRAMGMKRTVLPFIVFVCGVTGAAGATLMQWWTSAVDYRYVIAAKEYFSWPAFIPVIFECMVLFAALGVVLGIFHLCRLPQLYHPLFHSERFESFSDDKFFISIEAEDDKFELDATRALLEKAGASFVELIQEDA